MRATIPPLLRFEPVYQTRVWGGRSLENRFGRELPDPDLPFGESWEISAREEADCAVSGGPLAGERLSVLWTDPELRSAIFGPEAPESERFPLLCKILDAREKLSVQVHPPAPVAGELGGEPKTEAWVVAGAEEEAELYVGVRKGVTAERFRAALDEGAVDELVHRVPVREGDFLFIPSGRLHAIGAGLLIYEIQQNSDTTYRVFDWNRLGLDGKPRDLHVEESMRCIDFSDVEPGVDGTGAETSSLLCECEHFRLERHRLGPGESATAARDGRFAILTVVRGGLAGNGKNFAEGDFFMVPHGANGEAVAATGDGAEFLLTTWPGQSRGHQFTDSGSAASSSGTASSSATIPSVATAS